MSHQITATLNLSKDACLDDVLTAIAALLAAQPDKGARWTAMEAEIAALRLDIKGLTAADSAKEPADNNATLRLIGDVKAIASKPLSLLPIQVTAALTIPTQSLSHQRSILSQRKTT